MTRNHATVAGPASSNRDTAMAAGTPKLIPHEMAQYTAKLTGFPEAGWLSFQPLWQEICRTDPDLFD